MPLAHFEGSIFPKEPNLYYNVSSVDVEDAKDFTSSAKDDEIDVDEEEKVHSQSLLRSSSRPRSWTPTRSARRASSVSLYQNALLSEPSVLGRRDHQSMFSWSLRLGCVS